MNQLSLRTILTVSICAFLLGCGEDGGLSPIDSDSMTMDDIYYFPITDVVGGQITLQENVTWHLDPVIRLLDDNQSQSDTLIASWLSILYEEADEHMEDRFRDEERGNIFLVSPEIYTEFNDQAVEEYFFRDHKFDTSLTYNLIGIIEYRDWLSPPPLGNPDFINQSNNPAYWSQTFEFRLFDAVPLAR